MPIRLPLFGSLNYDMRCYIYDVLIGPAGFQQHILCPSITRHGQAKEFYSSFLVSRKCDRKGLETCLGCGHWNCIKDRDDNHKDGKQGYRLADLIALMRTCKFGYFPP